MTTVNTDYDFSDVEDEAEMEGILAIAGAVEDFMETLDVEWDGAVVAYELMEASLRHLIGTVPAGPGGAAQLFAQMAQDIVNNWRAVAQDMIPSGVTIH